MLHRRRVGARVKEGNQRDSIAILVRKLRKRKARGRLLKRHFQGDNGNVKVWES